MPAWTGREGDTPYVEVDNAPKVLDDAALDALAADLSRFERGLIVCGPQFDPELAEPVARLASALGFPLLADPLSLVRCGPHDRDAVIDSYDAFLRDLPTVTGSKSVGEDLVSSRGSQAPDAREDTRSSPTADNNRIVSSWLDLIGEQLKPDVVLRFGAMPTSKPVLLFLQRFPDAKHVVIGEGWEDPMLLASRMVNADPRRTCEGLVKRVAGKPRGRAWLETWKRIDDATRQAITEVVGGVQEPFEGRVFAELANLLPDGATLWASSSMPVRDLDTFFPGNERRLTLPLEPRRERHRRRHLQRARRQHGERGAAGLDHRRHRLLPRHERAAGRQAARPQRHHHPDQQRRRRHLLLPAAGDDTASTSKTSSARPTDSISARPPRCMAPAII